MNAVANRLIVFAASAFALGTVAFGQTPMTAKIPFAFETVSGTLPAGTYEFTEMRAGGVHNFVKIQNKTTWQSTSAGVPMYDSYNKAPGQGPVVEFACEAGSACRLKAIRTREGSMVYSTPHDRHNRGSEIALVTVPLKTSGE